MTSNPFAMLVREDVPESRVALDAVIAGGRARVRRRRAVTVGAAAVAVVLVAGGVALAAAGADPVRPAPAPAQSAPSAAPSRSAAPACEPVRIAGLDRPVGIAVDASGQYLVGTPEAFDGSLTLVGPKGPRTLRVTKGLMPSGINGSGVIVGNVTSTADMDGYVVENDTSTRLGLPAGALNVRAGAINDAGDVVGDARMPGNRFRAVVWRYHQWSQPQLLATPSGGVAGGQSAAYGIAADGRIVGNVGNGATPYLWKPDGTGAPLPVPAGKPGGNAARIVGDWADGAVNYTAATVTLPSGRRVGRGEPTWVRWNLRTGEVKVVEAGHPFMGAAGLLPDGRVVVNLHDHAAVWSDAGVTRLSLPEGSTQVEIAGAAGDGTIVGYAVGDGDARAAYRWNCG
ncbi:hypothetical protein Dvina_22775 [Dactylosporangium vinaceum]|uniref:Uncharacterized protein n=1 Tax=Dactylosporangium vinaceum TaxID=53362 RepID=A0ABV5M715_9ACTN|nr:hypothetical protein [Dactylosporangium vinaceum]UAC00625.1 hypothetical protein Dvina_22775 [Dactylosporangium vinaceum]